MELLQISAIITKIRVWAPDEQVFWFLINSWKCDVFFRIGFCTLLSVFRQLLSAIHGRVSLNPGLNAKLWWFKGN